MTSERVPGRFVARDLLVVVATAVLWRADAALRGDAGGVALAVGVVTGLATALVGFLAHEWGHLAGSLASGSVVHFPPGVARPLLFHFDSAANGRRQFFWMSFGGYLATVLAVGAIVALCPLDALSGRVAAGLGVAGLVVTFALEVPITWRVARGAALPTGVAYRKP
jgi:small-conductance mechanosensitive channel